MFLLCVCVCVEFIIHLCCAAVFILIAVHCVRKTSSNSHSVGKLCTPPAIVKSQFTILLLMVDIRRCVHAADSRDNTHIERYSRVKWDLLQWYNFKRVNEMILWFVYRSKCIWKLNLFYLILCHWRNINIYNICAFLYVVYLVQQH